MGNKATDTSKNRKETTALHVRAESRRTLILAMEMEI